MASSSVSHSQRNIAILLGSVAAATIVGAGVYYVFNRKNKSKKTSNRKQESDKPQKSEDAKPAKQPSPLDKALELKNRGNECFKDGRYNESIKFYTEAIEACPPDASPVDLSAFYQNRAAAQEKMNNFDAVIDDCTKALEGNKQYLKAIYRRARAYEQLEKLKEAFHDYTAVCVLERFVNFTTISAAESVLKKLSAEQAKQALFKRGDQPIALSHTFVDSYLQSFAEDPVFSNFANTSTIMDDSGGAGEANVTLNGNDTANLTGFAKAKHLLKEKEYNGVIDACTDEIAGNGDKTSEALFLRGTMYLIMGSSAALDDFDNLFEQLKNRSPEDLYTTRMKSNAYIKRGSLFMQFGQRDEAFQNFQFAEDADRGNADVYQHRGQLLLLLGELDRARSDFDKAAELRPDFPLFAAQRCFANYRASMATGDLAAMHRVMCEFQSIIEKYPDYADCYALYAQALAENDDYEEAKRMYDTAIRLSPTNANIYVHKALLVAQAKEDDVGMSIKIIEKALKIDPCCEIAYEALATTELQRGNIDRALELLQTAIKVARTELEITHLFTMYETAAAQKKVALELGMPLANVGPGLIGLG